MDSSVGTSEIVEFGEESNLGNHSHRTKPVRIKLRECEEKFHGFPIKNDFSRLMESIDLQKLPRTLVASNQFVIKKQRDDTLKKPFRVGSLQESGFGNPEPVNLKQALRKLCISQASEQAAMRRTSKPVPLSFSSEAATISRLFASLMDEGNKADLSVVEGKSKVGVPIKCANIASNASQKITQVCDLRSAELSSRKIASSPHTVATASNATKVRMKDVMVPSKIASSMHNVASTSKTPKSRILRSYNFHANKKYEPFLVTNRSKNKTKSKCDSLQL